jgi:predicted transposase/invertase (TIGR01784 family)
MAELLDPRNDFLFKRIFGSEENKDVLLAFLNRTFTDAGMPSLTEIILLNPYTDKESPKDKQSILDIKGKTSDGEFINVEMQLFNKYDTEKRTLFYWSKQYAGQLLEGQTYRSLKKCVTINILNYSFLPNEQYHSVFHLKEDKSGISLVGDIEVHILELPKLTRYAVPDESGGLVNWLLFLQSVDKSNWEVLAMNEPELKKAMSTLEYLSQNDEARRLYEGRQKYLLDELSTLEAYKIAGEEAARAAVTKAAAEGKAEGKAEGISEGERKKAVEIARTMLAMGLDLELIVKASGLSEADIQSL